MAVDKEPNHNPPESPDPTGPAGDSKATAVEIAGTDADIIRFLLQDGVLSEERLAYARRIQSKLKSTRSLLSILTELDYVTAEQQRATLQRHRVSIKLGALLVELGYLREADLRAALAIQRESGRGKKIGEILLENHFIEEHRLIEVLSDHLGFPNAEPDFNSIDKKLLEKANPSWYRRCMLVPLSVEEGAVRVVFADPLDRKIRQEAEQVFGVNLIPMIASKRSINHIIRTYDRSFRHAAQQVTAPPERSATEIFDTMLADALEGGASDIHIEPLKEHLRIRFRRDGILIVYKTLAKELAPALSNRIKILAKADIAEKRRHQDGRIMFEDAKTGRQIDIRVSIYVTIHGEQLVLRLLRRAQLLPLQAIGLFPKILSRFCEDALDTPSGVIMITGPTGTGKTTTLYSCVNYLNSIDRSIITVEDPVEYVIEGIGQCSLNPKIDLTFESTLPHVVRQDPDVIVLGEIRDSFSAEAAIQAALTGHKVLTTFHTEDTIGGLLRLMNMDIETFLISSTVVSVLAQRLLRRVCQACAEPYQPNSTELHRLGYRQSDLEESHFKLGRGCSECGYMGYRGRVGVFELLVLNVLVKDAILQKKASYEIRRISLESSGMMTLLEDGLVRAAQGETSLAEVLRHLPRLDKPRPLMEIRRLAGVQ